MDPDPDPFLNDFMDVKKYNLPTGTSFSVLKILIFLLKFCVKILFCPALFQSTQHFYGQGKDPDTGGLKTCGSGFGSGSLTMLFTFKFIDKLDKL
jgi:hypothetical protein